jgi:hypothetical protein
MLGDVFEVEYPDAIPTGACARLTDCTYTLVGAWEDHASGGGDGVLRHSGTDVDPWLYLIEGFAC